MDFIDAGGALIGETNLSMVKHFFLNLLDSHVD